jgi:nicotinamide mononucleotide (NMN) deamidase PncC
MAELARERFTADIGIGIDGYIETENGAPSGKAFIAINIRSRDNVIAQAYPWRPNQLARRSVTQALFSLRKALIEL